MGDVGALAIGPRSGVMPRDVRQEVVTLVMGGVFVLETASVILQSPPYKLTVSASSEGAIHHHFELKGWRSEGHRWRFYHLARARVGRTGDVETAMIATSGQTLLRLIVGSAVPVCRARATCGRALAARGDRHACAAAGACASEGAGSADPGALGGLDTRLLDQAVCVVASPGFARGAVFREARRRGWRSSAISSCSRVRSMAPRAGITGTNGKSTSRPSLGRMAGVPESGGAWRQPREPALDLLAPAQATQLYVRSFPASAEATTSLQLKAASVLNVTPDHLIATRRSQLTRRRSAHLRLADGG